MLVLCVAALTKSFLLLLDNNFLEPIPEVAPIVSITVSKISLSDVDSFKISRPTASFANPLSIFPVKRTGSSSTKSSLAFSFTRSLTLSWKTLLLTTVLGFNAKSFNIFGKLLVASRSLVLPPASPENIPSKLALPFPYIIALDIASSSGTPASINWFLISLTSPATVDIYETAPIPKPPGTVLFKPAFFIPFWIVFVAHFPPFIKPIKLTAVPVKPCVTDPADHS